MDLPALTDDDAIWMAVGTAAEGLFSYAARNATRSADGDALYPSTMSTLLLGGATIAAGAMNINETPAIDRRLAAFLIGFGMSQFVSYVLPRLTGGESTGGGEVGGRAAYATPYHNPYAKLQYLSP